MIIKIEPNNDGGHDNQSFVPLIIPDGWAVIPEGMVLENFPFGTVTADNINGVMTVVNWIPGEIYEHKPKNVVISISNGGTGANNSKDALTNLGAAPAYSYGTEDLTAGVSTLETGKLHFVYE